MAGGAAATEAAAASDAAAAAAAARSGSAPCQARASSSALLLSMDDFANFRQIGKGKDSVVYSATCVKLGGASVVLKVYDKSRISAVKGRSVRREARIMRFLTDSRVPHVCHYIGAFQDSKQIYIVMEHASGGDLLEQLLREGRAMTEKRVVREVIVPMLTCLAHLHAGGVIHRDIKLENLFVSPTRGVLLGDFGLALCTHEEKPISPVGTLEYMPPEILRLPTTDLLTNGTVRAEDVVPVDEKVDSWSLGVTVFELVTGRSPFEGASKDEVRSAILRHAMRPPPAFLSPDCVDWVTRAMTPAAADRPGALELLRHRWVLRHLQAEDAARVADLRVCVPRMPVAPPPPAAEAAAGDAAAAVEQGGKEPAAEEVDAAAATAAAVATSAAAAAAAAAAAVATAAAATATAGAAAAGAAVEATGKQLQVVAEEAATVCTATCRASSAASASVCAANPSASSCSSGAPVSASSVRGSQSTGSSGCGTSSFSVADSASSLPGLGRAVGKGGAQPPVPKAGGQLRQRLASDEVCSGKERGGKGNRMLAWIRRSSGIIAKESA
ncbi:aurora like kinase [Raphidocelis subcapitata]|uniref:Aurora like kinase n=1 Tax=Raphidocelis subcapitata TaxID=307507 RepID=A0A2V0NW08_9CHLO|nr:aurora like kinase [Raphidocelis subcapitata]|eukprot:GBF89005.1 aurora like kinase [Raphidocelis subcapitata]